MNKTILSPDSFLDSIPNQNTEDEKENGEHARIVRMLTKAIEDELTERQRDCVHLYYYEGKNVSQIAHELQIGVPTASKHLKKARHRLSGELRFSFGEPE